MAAPLSPLEAALAALGAKPYHPVFQPLTPAEAAAAAAPVPGQAPEPYEDPIRRLSADQLRAQIREANKELSYIYHNKDLWDPKWGHRHEELEEMICDAERELKYRFGGEVRPEDEADDYVYRRDTILPEHLEAKQKQLWAVQGDYTCMLMSDPFPPGWDRMCANLEERVEEMEREFHELKAAYEAQKARPPTPRPAEPPVLEKTK